MDRLILSAINGKIFFSPNDWCKVHVFISDQIRVVGYEKKEYLFKIILNKLRKNDNPIILINQMPYRYVCSLSDPYTAIYFSNASMSLAFIPDNSNVIIGETSEGVRCVNIENPIILYLSEKIYLKWLKKLSLQPIYERLAHRNKHIERL